MEKENKAGGLTHPDLKYIKKLQQLKKKNSVRKIRYPHAKG